jgi:hypothetical protein
MESTFNPYVWAYILNKAMKEFGIDPYERLRVYAEYHGWSKEFTDEVKNELDNLK